MRAQIRPRRQQPRGRARQQRRLLAAVVRARPAFPCSASSPPRTSRRRPRPRASRRSSSSSATSSRCSSRPAAGMADLLIGNNVLAQVPDLNDFVAGMKTILAPTGVITLEFPHVMRLIDENQFDTIYHEHFSYFSLHTVMTILADHGLEIFDVDELPTHGGSLRIYARHDDDLTPSGRALRQGTARTRGRVRPHRTSIATRSSPRRSRRPSATSSICSSGLKRRGQDHRRVRRAGEGQHAPELLRHPHRLPRLHRRPEHVQAGPVPAGHAHPDLRAGRRSTVAGPTTCSSFRGT